MQRILEPGLMTDYMQCLEYGQVNRTDFFKFILSILPNLDRKIIADFCSGPGQLAEQIVARYDVKKLDLIDASYNMQNLTLQRLGENNKIHFLQDYVENINALYDVIVSINSAHHFENLEKLLSAVQKCSHSSTKFLLVDLNRPSSNQDIENVIRSCFPSLDMSSLFYKDFFNSLRASYSSDEVYATIKNFNFYYDLIKIPKTELELWICSNYEII